MHRLIRQLRDGFVDPAQTTPHSLIRHRVVAYLSVALIPLLGLRSVEDFLIQDWLSACSLLFGALCASTALLVLARTRDARKAAAVVMTGGYAMLATMLIGEHVLDGTTWTFLPLLIILAALLIGRLASLAAGLVNMAIIAIMYGMHTVGMKPELSYAETRLFDAMLLNGLTVLVAVGFSVVQEHVLRTLEDRTRALEREVEERRRAEAEAQQAMHARTRFLAAVSHELRTPLHGVVSAAHLIEAARLPPDQRRLLDTIQTSSDLLLELIDGVLSYARMDSGRMTFERVPVRVSDLLDTVAAPIRAVAEGKGLRVRVVVAGDVPEVVLGDPTRLRQILVNLAGNAVKFTHHGEVVLEARGAEPVCLIVRDTGIGMTADQVESLFEPFVQGDTQTYREYGGSGLGMALVQRIVEHLDGDIEVDTAPGRGTAVTVRLHLPATDAPVPGEAASPLDRIGLRVLVADDNPVNRMLARVTLERAGHVVIEATHGAEAVTLAQGSPTPDLVLMDCQMPVLDGFEATRALRAIPELESLPVLALTAASLEGTRRRAAEAGMDGVLSKPIEPEALLDAVAAAAARDRAVNG